jgi:hypothetical protein
MSVRRGASQSIVGRRSLRLDAVLRAGQVHREATATVATGVPPPPHPPLRLEEIALDLRQLITKTLIADPKHDAVSLCANLQAWCRAHPIACANPDLWRLAFEALVHRPRPPPPPPNPNASPEMTVWELFGTEAPPDDLYEGYDEPPPPEVPPPASYRDAFLNACRQIDRIREGHPDAMKNMDEALRRSHDFVTAVAVVDAEVLLYTLGFDGEELEDMRHDAIVANARNARSAVPHPDDGETPGNIAEHLFYDAVEENPEALRYLPGGFDFDTINGLDLEALLERDPLALQYLYTEEGYVEFDSFYDDECLMLKLAKKDGQSLQFMSEAFRSNKRIVMAALESGGPEVFEWVMGAATRDPDVRAKAGLEPLPYGKRIVQNPEDEESCD